MLYCRRWGVEMFFFFRVLIRLRVCWVRLLYFMLCCLWLMCFFWVFCCSCWNWVCMMSILLKLEFLGCISCLSFCSILLMLVVICCLRLDLVVCRVGMVGYICDRVCRFLLIIVEWVEICLFLEYW